jgi:hypothetical protein
MHWFLGCLDTESVQRVLPDQSIDVFVAQKRVDSGTPVVFFVEIYQEKGWSHEALLVSSSSLSIEWNNTKREDLGTGIRSTYEYELSGVDGSHIVDAIRLVGIGPERKEEIVSTEVFVDIGIEKIASKLEGPIPQSEEPAHWPWLIAGAGGVFLGWYMMRRKKISNPPPTLEERYRSQWGIFVQQESDTQERAVMLSAILRSYLTERFSNNYTKATPLEAKSMVEKELWSQPIKAAVLQIFEETDAIRFAGADVDEDIFATLGRSLEVIFSLPDIQ